MVRPHSLARRGRRVERPRVRRIQAMEPRPVHLDLDRRRGLSVEWSDGRTSFYTVEFLRRNSPSAEARALREELESNPLAVLPASRSGDGPLTAVDAELVGHYAVRIRFSDGHDTGIYSWRYLHGLDAPTDSSPTESS